MTGLSDLSSRREARCERFSLNSLKHPKHKSMFPINKVNTHDVRRGEMFKVNFAHTEAYQKSTVVYCQTKLNELHRKGLI